MSLGAGSPAWLDAGGPEARVASADVPFTVTDHGTRFVADAAEARALADDLAPAAATVEKLTGSLCPDCLAAGDRARMVVPMVVYEHDGEIRLRKRCPDHGTQSDVVWRDAESYHRARRWDERARHPAVPDRETGGPDATAADGDDACDTGGCCGSSVATGIGNITVTNRCDRSCHYCFFYAESGEPLHEPTTGEVREMAATLAADGGIGAIQLTGGEPTVREDIVDLVAIASEYADQVLLNSHGARFMHDPGLAHRISDAGARGLYTSFDGVDPETNYKSYWEFPHALSACRDAGMCAMLVPTVVGGWNDDGLGDIVRFGAANADTVCGVNFQPVSFVGRLSEGMRADQRVTISDVIDRIEDQTGGAVPRQAWLPLPVYYTVSEFLRQWTDEGLYGVTSSYTSWMMTMVFRDGDELVPITDVVDVAGLLAAIRDVIDDYGWTPAGLDKARAGKRLLGELGELLGPHADDLDVSTLVREAIDGDFAASVGDLYDDVLPLGVRHFQDPYNYDLDRVSDCDVHYAMPDGEVVPFSLYNVVPERYRDRAKAAHSITVEEWLDRDYTGLESADDDRRTRRGEDVIDADGAGEGVFGADLTYDREFDAETRGTVERAYTASVEDLDPVWSVV
jgi:uncharacterized radical SAM superfamily Fe-S cluster-containing enzyme